MKIWVDDMSLGAFSDSEQAEAALAGWKKENSDYIFYLYQCQGEQYSYGGSWDQFLKDNIRLDVEVKIITATQETLRLELVESTEEYLGRLSASIEGLAARFYAGPDRPAWELLSDFIEGMDFICQALTLLNCDFDREQFNRMLRELMQAMEAKDIITIADLLSYEWSAWLDKAEDALISPNN